MADELDLLQARRPEPAPSEDTVRRHRAQLREAIDHAAATEVGPAPGSSGDAAWAPADSQRVTARRRRRLIAVAAAAAAAVVTVALAVDRDTPTRVVAATPPASPAASDAAQPETFACGPELPATIDVSQSVSGPTAGPAAGNTRPVAEGQRVVHWVRPGGWVELRSPAAPPAIYDLSEPRRGHGLGVFTSSGDHLELAVSAPEDPQPTNERPHADVIIDTTGSADPTEACAVLEVEIVDATGATRTGVDLRHLDASVFLGALITAQEHVEAAPTEALPCQAPPGIDAPPNRSGSGTPGASPAPTAAEALQQFLTTSEAAGFAPGGYTELLEPNGTITYGRLIDGGDAFVVLISVVPSGEGWIIEGWTASGC